MADIRRTFELDWQTGKFEAGASKVKQALDSVDKELGDIDRHAGTGIKKINTELAKTPANVNKLQGSFSQLGTTIAAAFSVGALISFGKQIVDVRAKFEKMATVLRVTLGSQSEANKALQQIKDFAAKTPFSVEQLTNSYIKLVNRGIKPTTKELRAIGDLASSQGKDFEQLTDAILSASTGETEALKSFGIVSKIEGEKIKLTFKGITQEVDRNAESVKNAIVQFGNMNGVMGGMDAISETLTGKISNLGDSWDRLLNTIGEKSQTTFKETINGLSNMMNGFSDAIEIMDAGDKKRKELQKSMEENPVSSGIGSALAGIFAGFTMDLDDVKELAKKEYAATLSEIMEEVGITIEDISELQGTKAAEMLFYAYKNKNIDLFKKILIEYKKTIQDITTIEETIPDPEKPKKINEQLKNLAHTMATFSDEVGGGIGETMMRLNRMFDEFGSQFPELKPKIISVTDELEKLDKSIRNNPLFGPGGTDRGTEMGEAVFGDPDDPNAKPKAIIAGIEQVTSAFISAAMTIMDIERQKTETLISLQEQRVEAARALAEQGNAEILKLEQERLEKLTDEREKFARRQANLALLQTVAESALAIAKAAAEGGGFATAITVASTLAALAAGFAQARALASSAQTFEKGGQVQDGKLHGKRHSQGGIPIEAEGGEWIFSRGTTARHERLFKAIQTGKLTPQQTAWINNIAAGKMNHAPLPSFIDLTGGGNTELLAEVSELTKAVKNQDRMSVTIDENGIQAIASRVSYRQNRIRGKAGI